MTSNLPLVSLHQAQRLKALGFDWGVTAYYECTEKYGDSLEFVYQKPKDFNHSDYDKMTMVSVPTVAEALKWLRDVKKIMCFTVFRHPNVGWEHCHFEFCFFGHRVVYSDRGYLTNDLAEAMLLNEMLGKLEEVERIKKEIKK